MREPLILLAFQERRFLLPEGQRIRQKSVDKAGGGVKWIDG